ncbi:hypothetical protein [Rhodococcus pyridinivorans]|uniref:hypothetical protein n=1 Tax=Rhodococcus pyridinivorans TaxID=103816 RepID=UPI003AB048AE
MSKDAELIERAAVVLPDGFRPARTDKRIPVRRIYARFNPARDSVQPHLHALLGLSPDPEPQPDPVPAYEQPPATPVPDHDDDGSDWYDIDGERIYRWVLQTEDSHFIASDAAGSELRDENGQRIYVDEDGRAIAAPELHVDNAASTAADYPTTSTPTRKKSLFSRTKALVSSDSDANSSSAQLFDGNGVPIEDFDIGKVGKQPTVGRHNRGRRALAIGVTALAACSAAGLITGVVLGRSSVPAEGAISAEEAAAYRLTTFPVNAAVGFAQQYLDVCLTHGDDESVKRREQLLQAMGTPGAAESCGWTSGGLQQEPSMIVWDGTVSPITEFPEGDAAYLGFTVSVSDGQYLSMSVPVWVRSSKVSNDMRIVGDIGVTAPMRLDNPPPAEPNLDEDPNLAAQTKDSLIRPFLAAWGASDSGQLNLVLADSAVARAKTGLGGMVTNPKIDRITVRSPRATSTPANQPVSYEDGNVAVAEVRVTWDVPSSESTQTTGYRVEIVRHSGKWLVVDVRAGLVDRGGAASSGSGIGSANDLVPGAASTRGNGE